MKYGDCVAPPPAPGGGGEGGRGGIGGIGGGRRERIPSSLLFLLLAPIPAHRESSKETLSH